MALFGNKKDESDLGDVSRAIDFYEQKKKDKERLLIFIREYGRDDCRKGVYEEIEKIIDKYI